MSVPVVVHFQDGEKLKGKTEQVPRAESNGFWVMTPENQGQADRVFVSIAATKKVEVLKKE